jgi:hypothetical protein
MHKKGNKVVSVYICDTRRTFSIDFTKHCAHLNSPRRKHAYGSWLKKLATIGSILCLLRWTDMAPLWRVCARKGRSHQPPSHSPSVNKMTSEPGGGEEATWPLLSSSVARGSYLLALAAARHLPKHVASLVERDLSVIHRHRTWPFLPFFLYLKVTQHNK